MTIRMSTLLPVAGVIVSTSVIAWFANDLLEQAKDREIEMVGLMPLFLALLVIAGISTALVFLQSARSARRLTGPVHRIKVGMQRVRQGDIAHRVHLRRDDELSQLAAEFNTLLDWLNENPPAGVRTGGDVVEMEVDPQFSNQLDECPDPVVVKDRD